MKRILFIQLFILTAFFSNGLQAQWVKTNGPEGMSVEKLYRYHNYLYCGTNAQGVYISLDNGITWHPQNIGLENKWVLSLTSDSLYLYAGVLNAGVYRSSDDGLTWQPAGVLPQAVNTLLVTGGYVFAGTIGNGVYRSADHGNTWVDVNANVLTQSYIISMMFSDKLIVEADNYLFFSYDYGLSWNIDTGTTQFWVIDDFLQLGDTVIAAAGNSVFVSHDL